MLKDAEPGPGVAPASYNLVTGSVERVKARLTEAIRNRDHEKSKILANISKAFRNTIPKAPPAFMEEAASALSQLQAIAEDSIEQIINSANSSQRSEAQFFEDEAKKLESDLVIRINEDAQQEIKELQDLKSELAIMHEDRAEGPDDEIKHESTTPSRPNDVKSGYFNRQDSVETPDSGGKSFAKIWRVPHRRNEKPEKSAPLETPSDGLQPPPTWNRRNSFKLPAGDGGPFAAAKPSSAETDPRELPQGEMTTSQAGIRPRSPQKSPQPRPKETEKPNLQRPVKFQSHGQEVPRSGSGKYDHLDPLIGDALELADQINREFFASMKEADDPDADDWQTDEEEQSVELETELAEVKEYLSQQHKVVEEQQKEIEKLVTEKEALKTESQNLRAALGNIPQGIVNTGIPTGAPPETADLASASSVKSFQLPGTGSNVSTPGIAQVSWLDAWLPKSLHSHKERLYSALGRCQREERACTEKLLVLAGNGKAEAGKKFLQIHMDSSKQHSRDFILTVDFFDDLEARLKKGPPASVPLEEEIGCNELGMDSRPPTARSEISPESSFGSRDQDSGITICGSVSTDQQTLVPSGPSRPSTLPFSPASTAFHKALPSRGESSKASPSPGEARRPFPSPPPSRKAAPSPRGSQQAPSSMPGQRASYSPRETREARPSPRETQEAPHPTSEAQNALKSDNDDQQDAPDEDPEDSEPEDESVEPQSPSSNVGSRELRLGDVIHWNCLFILRQIMAWFLVVKFGLLVVRYGWARGIGGCVGNHQKRDVQFPKMPPTAAMMIVVHHCLFFATAQVYVACQREKHIWFEANGLTRRYMLERYRAEASWLKIPSIDGNLIFGPRDLWHTAVWLVKCVVGFGILIWPKLQVELESDYVQEVGAYILFEYLVALPHGSLPLDFLYDL